MVARYSEEIRANAQALINAGKTEDEIRRETGISHRTCERWRHETRRFGRIGGGTRDKTGRPSSIPQFAQQALLEYLTEAPETSFDHLLWFLFDEFEIVSSRRSLSRVFNANKWTRTSLRALAVQEVQFMRDVWLNTIREYHRYQVVFIDESACNSRAADRKHGWSAVDFPVPNMPKEDMKRDKRWSVLPAYTQDGYLPGYLCFQGVVTHQMFTQWLTDHVLPHCTPFPGPRSVVVMDNAAIHRSPEIQHLIQSRGLRFLCLPPYSHDFNPVETSFNDIRLALRKDSEQLGLFGDFGEFLRQTIDRLVGSGGANAHRAIAHFKRAQVPE